MPIATISYYLGCSRLSMPIATISYYLGCSRLSMPIATNKSVIIWVVLGCLCPLQQTSQLLFGLF